MAREFAKAFYNSKQWKKCRAAYIAHRKALDGGLCESCHEEPGYIVHHKTELTPENINDPDITLAFHNLKYDCHVCHQKENVDDGPERLTKYEFTSEGELYQLPLNLKNFQTVENQASTYKKYRGGSHEGV